MGVQLDRELIPGTEVVFQGTESESIASQELVLIPRPTANEDDPLVRPTFPLPSCSLAPKADPQIPL